MKFKRKMFFGWLNLIHIISQSELDEGERGGTETPQNSSAKGEDVKAESQPQ